MKILGDERSGAMFSDDMRHRFQLWRIWESGLPLALFIMLNPSKAGAVENDPTVQRQIERVKSWGDPLPAALFGEGIRQETVPNPFGGILIGNACALVSPYPKDLFATDVDDAVGPDNGMYLDEMVARVRNSKGVIVCGWGKHLAEVNMALPGALYEHLIDDGPVGALKLNNDGSPCHPLYLGYDLRPRRWDTDELHEELV